MKKYFVLMMALLSTCVSFFASSAQVAVQWQNPDKYSDIRSGDEARKGFEQRVFGALEKHLAKLAAQLPERQLLKISVTNLDLAGEIEFGGARQIRVVREAFFPRINFSYQLLDSKEQVLASGDEKLKDMAFMMTSNLRYDQDPLGYEKRLLDNWFKATFIKTQAPVPAPE